MKKDDFRTISAPDIENSIDDIARAIESEREVLVNMGPDDIYGMNPNSNLAQIAFNLSEINKTLKILAEKLLK